jgi:DNA-directed RNA polymerase subunit RPC12/RpoP
MRKLACPYCNSRFHVRGKMSNYTERSEIICPACGQPSVIEVDELAYFVVMAIGGLSWMIVFLFASLLDIEMQKANAVASAISLVGVCVAAFGLLFKLTRVKQ